LFSREKVPIDGIIVEMPLAIAGAWHEEPVCSQMETGTTPRHTAVPEPMDEPPDEPAPAEYPPLRHEYVVPLKLAKPHVSCGTDDLKSGTAPACSA